MSTHLVAAYEALASATLARVDLVNDDILTLSGADRFTCPKEYRAIKWAGALGGTLNRATIVAPSLEVKRASADISPIARGGDAFTLVGPSYCKFPRELVLDEGENVELQMANDAAGADAVYGLISLSKEGELPTAPAGAIISVYGTNATALTANIWNTRTLTLEKELPSGRYALVGFHAFSATGIGCRALIPGQSYRPGVPMHVGASLAAAKVYSPSENPDSLYLMGEFSNTEFPQFQFLASAADAAVYVIAQVVKIA
jgi:hypothetical protein